MKPKIYCFALSLIGILLASCQENDLEHKNDFENSRKTWLSFKEANDNAYRYRVPGSSWAGTAWETNITVSDGVVTERDFRYTSTGGLTDSIPPEAFAWTENEHEIGSHRFTAAADALTLDEIYDKAQQNWLIDRAHATTYFETDNDGMISTCGYVENGTYG